MKAYLLVTSGPTAELRQVGVSTTYEADSSYLQLVENGSSLLVRSTDAHSSIIWNLMVSIAALQIKDCNGNYLTVTYNGLARSHHYGHAQPRRHL